MTVGLIVSVVVLVAALGAAVVGYRRLASPNDWMARATARRLVVHTSDDRSIEGTVSLVGDDGVVLTAARFLGSKEVEMAGDVWIPRGKIVFVQTVTS